MSEVEALRQEIARLKEELENKEWANQKTSEALKSLFSELEQKNKKLEEVDELKSDFISAVSHELRTPLTPIRESVSLILDGILGEVSDKQRRSLSIGLRNIDRLTRLINDLLDTSRIEAGKFVINKELVNIEELIQAAAATFSAQLKNKGLELKLTLAPGPLRAYIDSDRTTQIFTNLLNNAVKFTNKGAIEISLAEKEEHWECAVSDTGRGIPEVDLPKVFEKFQQVGDRASFGEKGTGLGLAICKGIVEAQGGKIWVESRLEQGTKFSFTLPKYTEQEVLREQLDEKIEEARANGRGFSLVLVRIEDYSELKVCLGETTTENIIARIAQTIPKLMPYGMNMMQTALGEIVVGAQLGQDQLVEMTEQVRRAVKDFLFGAVGEISIDFSFAGVSSPQDGLQAAGLLKKAAGKLVSERETRLKKTILIADDEPAIVSSLRSILKTSGYTHFAEAADGQQALEKIKTAVCDLLILDMKMPRMSGYEVIGRLKEDARTKDVPVLIMSGYEVEIDKLDEYIKAKAIPMVGKPFHIEQIKKLVDYLL